MSSKWQHECANELIVDRLLTILGIVHLHYQMIHADILIDSSPYATYLCASEDFKRRGESPLQFCIRCGWEKYIYQMLVVDFLILNRDRHGANIEVLRNSRNRTYRIAPLFDHDLSLIFSCTEEQEVRAVNVMEDKPVPCFVGSKSAQENLKLIPAEKLPPLNALRGVGLLDFV